MGRPPKPEDQKRQQICARFDPTDRDAILARAKAHGLTPNAEVENLATAFLAADETTTKLLLAIMTMAQEIQAATAGAKPWHQSLAKWSALRELVAQGAFEPFRPDRPEDDEAVMAAFNKMLELEEDRRRIVRQLNDLGVPATERPPKPSPGKGLFGSVLWQQGRDGLRALLKQADEIPARARAFALIDLLEACDAEIQANEIAWQGLRDEYRETECDGQQLARDLLSKRAREAREAGQPFSLRHYFGIFD